MKWKKLKLNWAFCFWAPALSRRGRWACSTWKKTSSGSLFRRRQGEGRWSRPLPDLRRVLRRPTRVCPPILFPCFPAVRNRTPEPLTYTIVLGIWPGFHIVPTNFDFSATKGFCIVPTNCDFFFCKIYWLRPCLLGCTFCEWAVCHMIFCFLRAIKSGHPCRDG